MRQWRRIIPGVYEGVPLFLWPLGLILGCRTAVNQGKDIGEELDRCVRLSNIPIGTSKTHRLATWQHKGDEPWWPEVAKYGDGKYDHPFLTLLGTVGTGKTHIAFGLGWAWLENGRSVLYYQVEDLLDALRRGYSSWQRGDPQTYDIVRQFTQNVHLLILDDFGAQHETEWAASKLEQIVEYRYINGKPLIATTNLALNRLPERISDRLSEGSLVQLTGESFRKQKKASRKE